MSDVRNESLIRFKFNEETCKEFNTWDKMYYFIKSFLNEPNEIEYKYIKVNNEYIKSDIIDYFSYNKEKNKYSIKRENKIWYLDYHIISSEYSCDDFFTSISVEELNKVIENTYVLFGKRVENPKVISYQWYTGCEEPIYYE